MSYHGLLDIGFKQEKLNWKKKNIYSSAATCVCVCVNDARNIKHIVEERN